MLELMYMERVIPQVRVAVLYLSKSLHTINIINKNTMDHLGHKELLTEITIDCYSFHVTSNPGEYGACILWFRNINNDAPHHALGKFKRFNKSYILDFIMRYASNKELRTKISEKKFEQKLETLSLDFFRSIKYKSKEKREELYRSLFNLDETMEKSDLAKRRRIMAKHFHPDAGGNNAAMSIINEAYDFLLSQSQNSSPVKEK